MSVLEKFKSFAFYLAAAAILTAAFTTCDSPFGMGESIDWECPVIEVTSVLMPDGTSKPIASEDNEKLLIGPWVLVTSGFTLEGTVWDNIKVERIVVDELSDSGEVNQSWTDVVIDGRAPDGIQKWSVKLDNIEQGERTLRLTAYDRAKNIGPDTRKQVTLLVDVGTPFIESIRIERHGGLQTADLIPRTILQSLDEQNYSNIDYFQNEQFHVRAEVKHGFSLTDVTLNLIDPNGTPLFSSGLKRENGSSVFTPLWLIKAKDIIDANGDYATGKHYFNVQITAVALAGQAGGNIDTTNMAYSLCWYPEADFAKIQFTDKDNNLKTTENIDVEKGGALPIKIFDDDNVDGLYAGLIKKNDWETNGVGLDQLINQMKNSSGYTYSIQNSTANLLKAPTRNTVIPLDTNVNKGEYKLLVLVKDVNDDERAAASADKWSGMVYNITVIEEGIPLIIVSTQENVKPALTKTDGGKFKLEGTVLNLDPVKFLKIAWIPNSLSITADEYEALIKNNNAGILGNQIKIWQPALQRIADQGNQMQWEFNQEFDVYNDFIYNGAIENAPKFFVLYTQSAGTANSDGIDEFKTFRLLAYTTPPSITFINPTNFKVYGQNEPIQFEIQVESLISIKSVKLENKTNGQQVTLAKQGEDRWIGSNSGHSSFGDYGYLVTAIDDLGNETQREVNVRVSSQPYLTGLSCLNPNGAYTYYKGDTLTFSLTFSGSVYGSASITLNGVSQPLNFTQTKANAAFSLNASWTVPQDIILDPLTVASINVNNVLSAANDQSIDLSNAAIITSVRTAYNNSRGTTTNPSGYIKIISRKPVITQMLGSSTLTGQIITPNNSMSKLTLTFDRAVWPENGTITIKPNGNWYIPPVLTNDEFTQVENALSGTNKTWLTNAYQRTTHGLLKDGSGNTTGTPDTGTKYVLDFNTGISGTGATVDALRTAFNAAKYKWQEIEVRMGNTQITGNSGAVLDNGSTIIEVNLDQLSDGRQWKVEISDGAFRDEAGNTFAGWGTSTGNWFWSQTVATPVIRVNRVSNNSYSSNPTGNNDNTARTFTSGTGVVETKFGTNDENVSRVNVQYRIDCETPDAVINYGTLAKSSDTVNNTTNAGGIFRPNSDKASPANSNNADASSTELNNIAAGTQYSLSGTNYPTIGDNSISTARKDYIAASATRTGLDASSKGYEGAFKTVIVYRSVGAQGARYVKYEGTNVHNGPTTIPGFPMSNNDMTGKTSKYAYKSGDDWIWISWEIVSEFWHVGLAASSATPNSGLDSGAWVFQNDWQNHSYRKYGNWGLRIGD